MNDLDLCFKVMSIISTHLPLK